MRRRTARILCCVPGANTTARPAAPAPAPARLPARRRQTTARPELAAGRILDTVFEGSVQEAPEGGVIPREGRAFVTAENDLILHSNDPFAAGIGKPADVRRRLQRPRCSHHWRRRRWSVLWMVARTGGRTVTILDRHPSGANPVLMKMPAWWCPAISFRSPHPASLRRVSSGCSIPEPVLPTATAGSSAVELVLEILQAC